MILFSPLARWLSRSLALRWVLYVTSAAGLGLALLLTVTYKEMEYQVDVQGEAVRGLARHKAAERIDAEIELVEYRLTTLFQNLERALVSVSQLRSTLGVIKHSNDVAIAADVGQRLVRAGFSGALVVDRHLNVIGSDRTGAELVSANNALRMHELHGIIAELMKDADRSTKPFRYIGTFDASHAAIFLTALQDDYGGLLVMPVFDEFGDPVAAIVAYRVISRTEPALVEFTAVTDSKIALLVGRYPISTAGVSLDEINLGREDQHGLVNIPELKAHARCRPGLPGLTICVMRLDDEIDRFSNEIMALGREQFRRARSTLTSIGGLSLIVILLLLIALGRRLTRPLSEITASIDLVARGEWRVELRHTNRLDEIGRIARAISAMQVSIAERDRMRQEMIRIDAINQRRLVLDTAVARFEDGMAVVTKNIADTIHALAETNEALDAAARRADSQAEKIRRTSDATASSTQDVSRSTDELSRMIREIGERVRNASSVVHLSESHALAAEAKLSEVSSTTHHVEEGIGVLQALVADLGKLGLETSIDAAAHGERKQRFAPMAEAVATLAGKAAQATDAITRELARIEEYATGAVGEIGEIRDVLGEALRETREISVTVEEQDAATREIADGLKGSAEALTSLSDAVDQLRASMASASEASVEFVLTARRIADDAKSIDGSIRSFIREVAA